MTTSCKSMTSVNKVDGTSVCPPVFARGVIFAFDQQTGDTRYLYRSPALKSRQIRDIRASRNGSWVAAADYDERVFRIEVRESVSGKLDISEPIRIADIEGYLVCVSDSGSIIVASQTQLSLLEGDEVDKRVRRSPIPFVPNQMCSNSSLNLIAISNHENVAVISIGSETIRVVNQFRRKESSGVVFVDSNSIAYSDGNYIRMRRIEP